jgi:hypothetical protein
MTTRESHLWTAFEHAKVARDQALQQWRMAYEKNDVPQETAARKSYFVAREKIDQRFEDIRSFYGDPQMTIDAEKATRRTRQADENLENDAGPS